MVHIPLVDRVRQDRLNDRLHFCVFDNGANDLIYVGTKYGMWSQGEFDLSIEGQVVFAGKVEHLVYEGVTINNRRRSGGATPAEHRDLHHAGDRGLQVTKSSSRCQAPSKLLLPTNGGRAKDGGGSIG
jgi:hypothetical protein